MAARSRPPALSLHLDVSGGVRADALVGALVAVGAPRARADEAIHTLLGPEAFLMVETLQAHGVRAQRARIEGPGLSALADEAADAAAPRGGQDRRRRSRSFVRDKRRGRALAPVGEAQAQAPDAPPANSSAPRRARTARRDRAVDLCARLAQGERGRPADLLVALRSSALPPVSKALALRAGAALVEGFGRVAGAVDEPVLEGAFLLRALAQVGAACALVEALSPAAVSASVVGVSSRARAAEGGVAEPAGAPSPWLMSVLEGAWVVERDDVAASDVVGAALVRTLAARFGARGLVAPLAQGFGVSALKDAPVPLLVRASTARMAPLATRAGEARATPCVGVRALLDVSTEREALARALFEAGAIDVALTDGRRLRGEPMWVLDVLGGPGSTDALCRALWCAGAERVATSWLDVRAPGLEDVTVPVGRGRTKGAVRVRATRDEDGVLLSARCVTEDVREVARATKRNEEVVRAEALQEFFALAERDEHRAPKVAARDHGLDDGVEGDDDE